MAITSIVKWKPTSSKSLGQMACKITHKLSLIIHIFIIFGVTYVIVSFIFLQWCYAQEANCCEIPGYTSSFGVPNTLGEECTTI